MTGDAFTERLLDLAYGELPAREAREVEAHAASCEACRAELAKIRGTRRVMAALPHEPAPERGERILLAAAREAADRAAERRRRPLVPRWLLGGAVVAASVVVVGIVSYRVAELSPRRDDRNALMGESPYASPPPAPAQGGAAPALAERDEAPAEGLVARRAEPPPSAPERPRMAAAPPAAKAAPPPPQRLRGYVSPPPARAAAPAGPAPAEAEAGAASSSVARAEPYADAAPGGPAASAAPMAAAPSRARDAGAAERKMAAAPPPPEVRSFPGCEGEAVRTIERDARGRIVRYVREGRVEGRRLRISQAFAADGRPGGVTVTDLDAPGATLDARALGLSLAASAEDALDAPPRCGR